MHLQSNDRIIFNKGNCYFLFGNQFFCWEVVSYCFLLSPVFKNPKASILISVEFSVTGTYVHFLTQNL